MKQPFRFSCLLVMGLAGAVVQSPAALDPTSVQQIRTGNLGNGFPDFCGVGFQSGTVTGTRRNARYEITVIDHGHGMTAGQMSDIAPFRQFDREQRNQQGLGLGLTIARSVAELAGGRLTLSAHRDGSPGLQATFDLPCTD